MLEMFFWISIFFTIYPYVIYPSILWILSKLSVQPIRKSPIDSYPELSIVVAVKNGEDTIKRRLQNLLALDYPKNKVEIIVVSDGSTDRTEQIVEEFISQYSLKKGPPKKIRIKKIAYFPTRGKAYALNQGVNAASGEILLFADSRQIFDASVAKELIANFNDQKIGCVSGELCLLETLESAIQVEMGAYWNYEKWIRKLESSTGSVVGATGAIYAIRRKLYKPLPEETLLDDVLTPMNIVLQGYRVIFEPAALAYDTVSKDLSQERKRKLRTLSGNWQLLSLEPSLFLPWKNPVWWRFISHKMSRLIVPFVLPVLLASSLLGQSLFYKSAAVIQAAFYFIAFLGWLIPSLRKIRIFNLSYFFMSMNCIAAAGFFVWCFGKSRYAWKDNSANRTSTTEDTSKNSHSYDYE